MFRRTATCERRHGLHHDDELDGDQQAGEERPPANKVESEQRAAPAQGQGVPRALDREVAELDVLEFARHRHADEDGAEHEGDPLARAHQACVGGGQGEGREVAHAAGAVHVSGQARVAPRGDVGVIVARRAADRDRLSAFARLHAG